MENTSLNHGQAAPDFELMNQDKNKIKLSSYLGKKKVILLFYPMDFSPICTQEHCSFGPELGRIAKDDQTVVFGVSCDSPFCHAEFRKQYSIPYDLLSDTSRKMVKAYGMFAGEDPYNCSKRGTVIVGLDGRIKFYQEQPMREPRTVEDLEKASLIDDLVAQRESEGGASTGASR
ncbi:MAG: redoxin domain-containing protein [Planctomycetota bacterium]|nr:redoxin domain-containing protein [Planctomycetota bacterium]